MHVPWLPYAGIYLIQCGLTAAGYVAMTSRSWPLILNLERFGIKAKCLMIGYQSPLLTPPLRDTGLAQLLYCLSPVTTPTTRTSLYTMDHRDPSAVVDARTRPSLRRQSSGGNLLVVLRAASSGLAHSVGSQTRTMVTEPDDPQSDPATRI